MIVFFAASIFSNMIFLLIRSFTLHKIVISISSMMQDEKTDFLEKESLLSGIIATFFAPTFVLFYIVQ